MAAREPLLLDDRSASETASSFRKASNSRSNLFDDISLIVNVFNIKVILSSKHLDVESSTIPNTYRENKDKEDTTPVLAIVEEDRWNFCY
jgi:hypothetical protein